MRILNNISLLTESYAFFKTIESWCTASLTSPPPPPQVYDECRIHYQFLLCQNPHWWSPIILTMKLTFLFWFSSVAILLQFVTTDLQTSYHSFAFRFLCLFSFKNFLYKDGLLSTSHINFSMSSTTDMAIWQNTRGLCTLLQAATVQLPVCVETVTCAFYCYQQQFHCPKDGPGCNLSPYSIQLQVPFILEAISPYAIWGCTMLWWEESTCALYYLIIYGTDSFAFP